MAAAYTAEVWEMVVRAVCRVCQPEVRDHSRMAVNPQCGVLGGWVASPAWKVARAGAPRRPSGVEEPPEGAGDEASAGLADGWALETERSVVIIIHTQRRHSPT